MVKLKDIIVLDCHVHPRNYIKVSLEKVEEPMTGFNTYPFAADFEDIPLNVRNVAYYGDYEVVSLSADDGRLDVVIHEPKE